MLSNRRITLQGFPTATQFPGTELVTTLPAPITLFSPIVTPGRRIQPPPIHTLSFISIGRAKVLKNVVRRSLQCGTSLSCGKIGCEDVYICTFDAIKTLLPIRIGLLSTKVQFILITTIRFFRYAVQASTDNFVLSCRNSSICFFLQLQTTHLPWRLFILSILPSRRQSCTDFPFMADTAS